MGPRDSYIRGEMKSDLETLIAKAELTNEDMASVLGITVVAVINKRAGRRRWNLNDAAKIAALISARIGRRISIEQTFQGSGIDLAAGQVEVASAGRRAR